MTSRLLAIFALCLIPTVTRAAAADQPPIRILVWDERQPAQQQAYGDKFLGQTIAEYLSKNPALAVRSAGMPAKGQPGNDPALTPESLDATYGQVPKRDAALTPNFTKRVAPDGTITLDINLPNCVFPAYRADGKPSHVTTLLPDHPIAKGLPKTWEVGHTEMYDEPFHVPAPDAVIFEERWDAGEHFRAGCLWNVGKGKVFYFRPGHETFPVYKEALPLKVIENAVLFLGQK